MVELNKEEKLPFKFIKIGRWWHRGEKIDLVAVEGSLKKSFLWK